MGKVTEIWRNMKHLSFLPGLYLISPFLNVCPRATFQYVKYIFLFKVESEGSKWICEALFGRMFPVMYPCQVCYVVFAADTELRDHFRMNHGGMKNLQEEGLYYSKEEDHYTCPTCRRNVCSNQKNSISFAFHLRKCSGQTFPVERSCEQCGKCFDSYPEYKLHVDTSCNTKQFLCHVCKKVLGF